MISHALMLAEGKGIFLDVFQDVPRKPDQKHVKMLLNPSHEDAALGMNLTLSVTGRAVFTRPDLITACHLPSLAQKQLRNIITATPIVERHLDAKT